MTQRNYTPRSGFIGTQATSEWTDPKSGLYAGLPEIWTLTFGGTASDGTYSVEFQELDVDNITISTVRTGGVPATNTDLAAQFVIDANANDDIRSFFLISSAGAVVTIQARDNGNPFVLANAVAPGTGTLTPAQTQSSEPADLPMGIGVAYTGNGDKEIGLPNGSTAFQIIGFSCFGRSGTNNRPWPTRGGEDFQTAFAAGSMVPLARDGVWYLLNEIDMAQGDPVFVRTTAGAGEALGEIRNDADGGDAVQIQAVVETAGLARQGVAVRLNLPGGA